MKKIFCVNNNLNFSNYKFHYKFAYNEFLREKNFPHRYRVNLNFSYPSKSEERATGSKLRNIDIKKNSIQIQILKKENRKITYKKIACLFFFFSNCKEWRASDIRCFWPFVYILKGNERKRISSTHWSHVSSVSHKRRIDN